jgi:hypothetical protein
MIQILIHLWGDYLTQSDWMAQNKTKAHLPAAVHALVYSAPFLFIGSWKAVLVICATHFLIDRYRLARYVVWAKNFISPKLPWVQPGPSLRKDLWEQRLLRSDDLRSPSPDCQYREVYRRNAPLSVCPTGYPPQTPPWLAFWLLIIADNTLHLTINYIALRWL